jgi:TolB protein
MVVCAAADSGLLSFIWRPDNVTDYIHLVHANGTGVRRLTANSFEEGSPSWHPSGRALAFEGFTSDVGIYVIDADGGNQRRLSPSPGFDLRPSFSPDGASIVYCRVLDPGAPGVPPTEIRVMRADGSDSRVILPTGPAGTFNLEPRWGGPNNDTIVFFSNRVPGRQLCFTMRSDGSDVRQITNVTCGDPQWSPSGSRISFGSTLEGGGRLNIFTMDPDGGNVVQLTRYAPPWEAGDTGFSPDGSRVAFEADYGGGGQSNPSVFAEVRIVNADGTGGEVSTGVRCSSVNCSPRFQPLPQ